MTYAALRHLAPPRAMAPAGEGTVPAPWEIDADISPARQETWLLSFIDILALLLTLFVLLLAHQAQRPEQTAREPDPQFDFLHLAAGAALPTPWLAMSETDGFALPGDGLSPLATVVPSDNVSTTADVGPVSPTAVGRVGTATTVDAGLAETVNPVPAPESAFSEREPPVPEVSVGAPLASRREATVIPGVQGAFATAQRTSDDMLARLKQSELGRQVEVTAVPGSVSLEISDSILFTPASAALSGKGLALLDQLAAILRTFPYNLSVEGHTDNVPIQTPRYPSNWELSAARAAMVTRTLIDQGIAADRVRAVGYGDTRPRGDNLTPEGRARNRRVTFVLQVPEGE